MASLKKAREFAHALGYGIVKGRITTYPYDVILPDGAKHESRSIAMCIEIIKNTWRRNCKGSCHQGIVDATIKELLKGRR